MERQQQHAGAEFDGIGATGGEPEPFKWIRHDRIDRERRLAIIRIGVKLLVILSDDRVLDGPNRFHTRGLDCLQERFAPGAIIDEPLTE